jgi:putative transposase
LEKLTESADGGKVRLGVLNDLKKRDTEDILIACVDGLTVFPKAEIQLCIVHQIRNSIKFWQARIRRNS